MDRDAIIIELNNLLGNYLKEQGLDLIELIYHYEGKDLALRILVDKPEGGISLGECARLNNELSNILDEKDILQNRYILEVFSPGLDRPLKTKGDFLRCINKDARFFLSVAIDGKRELAGIITKVEDDSVYIEIEDRVLTLPLSKIKYAKQILDNI